VFDVDPGQSRGDTTITMTYLHAPQAGGNPPANTGYVGTTSYSEFEQVVFGRRLHSRPRQMVGAASAT
jgi:hypothetical protein